MRTIVTGGAGFIGSHLVDVLLARGDEVCVIDTMVRGSDHWTHARRRPVLAQVDVTDPTAVLAATRAWRPQVVFHLAADHFIPFCESNPLAAYRLNVGGTVAALAAAHECDVERFFFASTADVYPSSESPHQEDQVPGPFTVYGRTKLAGEWLMRDAARDFVGALVVGRLFNAVGERETNPHLVPEVVAQIASGTRQLRLGNLSPLRDFVDVQTMASAIVDLTFASPAGVTVANVASGHSVTVSEMVDAIVAAFSGRVEIGVDPAKVRPSDRPCLRADVSRLRSLIGYAPSPAGHDTLAKLFAEAQRRVVS